MTVGRPGRGGGNRRDDLGEEPRRRRPCARAKIAYETALKEYERAKGLVADQIISAKEFEQVRLRYENARTTYEAQAADMTASGVRVTSPISGYVTSGLVGQGDYVPSDSLLPPCRRTAAFNSAPTCRPAGSAN